MKAWGNLPFSLRRENTENAVANATRVHPWDVKNKTGSRVQTIPRDIPSSTDVPVLLLNHSIVKVGKNYYCNTGIHCVMWMGFGEEKFLEVAQEINNIKLDGYEFFTESVKESVECKIYRKYDTVSGLYEYKIMGSILDVLPNVCKEVYMDLEYRKKWDEHVNGMGDIIGC